MVTVGDRSIPWRAGLTVADIARALNLSDAYLLADLDGKLVWRRDWAGTLVVDGATLRFQSVVGGG
jgi:sulfur carrier protein ThiS